MSHESQGFCALVLKDDLLLLKKGGHSIYFGELGVESDVLIKYFERHGTQRISLGDNPANWLMREYPKSKNDYADIYLGTPEYARLREQLARAKVDPPKELEITYISKFAVPAQERRRLVTERLQTVYWRSPTYNLSRLLVCIVIALILGSVFITERQLPILTETNMRAYFSVTFLSFIIIGILSITSVLPVMLAIRDVFYKHRAAGMTDSTALGWALGSAEKWFIILASALFCLFFLATAGTFPTSVVGSIKFWVSKMFDILFACVNNKKFINLLTSAICILSCAIHAGILYIQSRDLLLFRPGLHVFGAVYGYCSNLVQCFHWTEQLLFRIDCPTTIYDRSLRSHVLDHSWTLCL